MFTQAFEILTKVYFVVAALVAAVEDGDLPDGPAKKIAAEKAITDQLPAVVPAFLIPVIQGLLGILIDKAVALANSKGLFRHAAPAA